MVVENFVVPRSSFLFKAVKSLFCKCFASERLITFYDIICRKSIEMTLASLTLAFTSQVIS